MAIAKQPSKKDLLVIRDFLEQIEKEGLVGIVGGGWVRDTILGREPKDIDFFIEPSDKKLEFPDKVYTDQGSKIVKMGHVDTDYADCHFRDDVKSLIKLEYYPGNNINPSSTYLSIATSLDVIEMSTSTEDTVSGFDCSICQVYAKLEDKVDEDTHRVLGIYASDDFIDGEENNCIYFYEGVQVRDSHRHRINEKYKGREWIEKPNIRQSFTRIRLINLDYGA
jgi:hypothetical protein